MSDAVPLVVLDVNVLISAYLFETSLPGLVYSLGLDGGFEHAISREMADKLEEVLSRPKFRRQMGDDDPRMVAEAILGLASVIVQPDSAVIGVADDLEDDRIIGVAVASGASMVVTGDKGLLAVERYGDIRMLTPREFLQLLES